MYKVPFYPNSKDNTHCYQAALKMVLGYFTPKEKYTWRKLEEFTAKKKGKGTWPTQALLNFRKLDFDVQKQSTFDYEKFVNKGGKYLIKKYGKEMGEFQIENSDIKQEIRLAKEYISVFGNETKLPTLRGLKKLLNDGYLLVINVNYYPLYNKKGYSGHFVVVFKIDNKYIYLHDPGLPPKSNVKIPLNNFIKAWEYPDRDSRNYQAFKLDKCRMLMNLKMVKVKIKNRHNKTVVVQIDNQDSGGNLVFVAHGLGGFKEQKHIESFAKAFIKAGYVVIRWDAANTIGESEGKIENATLTNYYEDFEDVAKWSEKQTWYKEPFVISGHSLGSACCVLYITKYASKIKALAPTSLFLSGKTYYDSLSTDEINKWKKQGYIMQESSSKPGVMKKLSWNLMENLLEYELLDRAKAIDKPTLLIVGSKDTGTPFSDQEKFLKLLKTQDKELYVIGGAPHTFREEKHLKEIETIIYKWAARIAKND